MKINEAAPGFWAGFQDEMGGTSKDPGDDRKARLSSLKDKLGGGNKDAVGTAVPGADAPIQQGQPNATPAAAAPDPSKIPAHLRSAEIKQRIAANQAAQQQRTQSVAPTSYQKAAAAVSNGNSVGLLSKPGVTTPADLAAASTTPAMKPGNTQVPPTKGNMVTIIDAGPRKFYMDRQGQWLEYQGNNWPNDLLTNTIVQRPTPGDVDRLAAGIAQGRLKPRQINVAAKPAPGKQRRK